MRKLTENEAAVVRGSLLNRACDERCPTKDMARKLYSEMYEGEEPCNIVLVLRGEEYNGGNQD